MASFFNLTLDTLAPESLTLTINDGARYATSVAVNLKIGVADTETNGYQMKIWGIASAENEADATWETYTTSKAVNLTTGDGNKTVSIKVRDDVGNETTAATASIILNTAVPVVTIVGPDKTKISKVAGYNTATISFTSDVAFEEYKVCVVASTSATEGSGTVIPTTNGSTNTSGSAGGYAAETEVEVTINGADLELASGGDGVKIVKVFVKNVAGTWSVA